jgi:hypothetical protein
MLLPEQTLVHPPQLSTLLEMLVSQPLVSLLPSQSAKPDAHAPEQTPLTQEGLGTLLVLQACPQPPHALVLFWVLVSHPSKAEPLQLPKPGLQAMAQVPDWHRGVPLVPLQTLLQTPQLVGSEAVLVSQPLLTIPSQLAQPGLQEAIVQLPLEQPAVPLATEQLLPQLPQ